MKTVTTMKMKMMKTSPWRRARHRYGDVRNDPDARARCSALARECGRQDDEANGRLKALDAEIGACLEGYEKTFIDTQT